MKPYPLSLFAIGLSALSLSAADSTSTPNQTGYAFPVVSSTAPSTIQGATAPAPGVPQTIPTLPTAINVGSAGLTPTSAVAQADPQPGDTVETVISILGKPNGVIDLSDKSQNKSMMMYDRGNVVVADGKVLTVKLMPAEKYTAIQTALAQDEAQREANRVQLNALRDQLLNDPSYLALPTRDRLLALLRFERDHPGSDVHQDYLDLLAIYSVELAAENRTHDLQNQAAQANAQTAMAQQQAAIAQQQAAAAQLQAANVQKQPIVLGGGVTVITPNTNAQVDPRLPILINNTHDRSRSASPDVILVQPNGTSHFEALPGDKNIKATPGS